MIISFIDYMKRSQNMKNKLTGMIIVGAILLGGIMYYQTHHKSENKLPCCDPKNPHH